MYLETTIRSAIQFLDELCAVLGETIEKPTTKEQKLEHWQKAGETKFEFIKNRYNKRLKRDCQRVVFPVPMSRSGCSCCV